MGSVGCKPCCRTKDASNKSHIFKDQEDKSKFYNELRAESKTYKELEDSEAKTVNAESADEENTAAAIALSKVPLLRELEHFMIIAILQACERVTFFRGEKIIIQGQPGTHMFLLLSGDARVIVDGKEVSNLKQGEYFGETCLLKDECRTATIQAASVVEAIKLSRQAYEELGLAEQINLTDKSTIPPKQIAKIRFLAKVPVFRGLSETVLLSILDVCTEEKFSPGTPLITQGEEGRDLFLLIKGTARVLIDDKQVSKLKIGDYTGESGLLKAGTRTATVEATEKVLALRLPHEKFEALELQDQLHLVEKTALPKAQLGRIRFLAKVPLFDSLEERMLLSILGVCSETKYKKGQTIIEQGEEGTDLFIIIDGAADVMVNKKMVTSFTVGDYFGEQGLLTNETRSATIMASREVLAMKLTQQAFKALDLQSHINVLKK